MAGRLKQEIHKRGGFASLEQEVFLNLQRTADALARSVDEVLRPVGISPTQYNALRILRGAGEDGLACGGVSERMITHDPDMTRLLDRLERRSLISRNRETSDRRVVRARIAREGLSLLAKLDEPIAQMHRRQFAHMEQRDLRTLLDLLEKARSRADG